MPRNRVFIDGYFLGKSSGYGRFIYELCRCIGSIDAGFEFTIIAPTGTDAEYTPNYPNVHYVFAPGRQFPLWEQVTVPFWARRSKSQLIHFPYNTRALFVAGQKSVTTVHDMTFFNSDAKRDIKASIIHAYMRTAFNQGTRKSTKIVSVSDTTRRALSQIGVVSTRVYNTVDGFLKTPLVDMPAVSRPYFLHRGSYAPGHRNTDRIIRAFLSVPLLRDRYSLKILGTPNGATVWNTAGEQAIEYLPRVSDAELASLYAGSSCVVAASLLEGFCLPIIEAFGFSSPVIASNIDPMREIAGSGALLVAPGDQEQIAAAMARIATDPTLAATLVKKGRERLETFAWQKSAHEILDVYRSALGIGPSSQGHYLSPQHANSTS